jgi:hypothetical protein
VGLYDAALYDAGVYDAVTGDPAKVELYINGVWTDVTGYVRFPDGITITRGRQDEQSSPASATCRLVFDNGSGNFSPTNTAGAYYPYLTLGTLLRVSAYVVSTASYTVRFVGNVYEWPVDWAIGPQDPNRVCTIVANGPRRRLQRNPALQGPYRRASLARISPVSYWPLEDASSATSFAPGFSGGTYGTYSGAQVSLAGDTTWAAAPAGLPTMGDFSTFEFFFPAYTPPAAGVNLSWLMSASVPSGAATIAIQVRTNGAHMFEVDYAPTADTFTVLMINQATGVTETTFGPTSLGHGQGVQSIVALSLVQNGTGIDWVLAQYTAADPIGVATSGTFTLATLGQLTKLDFFNGTGMATTIGHVFLQNAAITSLPTAAIDGYAGEVAYTRSARLSVDEGVAIVRPVVSASTFIGPQGMSTFLELFDEAAVVDEGISSEDVTTYALYWRGRRASIGAASVLTLDRANLLSSPATYDDALIVNDVTVTRPNGGSYRTTQTTGNRGTTTLGYYSSSDSVNVYVDSLLTPLGDSRLAAGVMDEPRLPAIVFDVFNSTVTDTAVVALREGDTITVTGMLAGSGVASSRRYLVTGWSETILPNRWLFAVVSQPHPFAYGFVLDSSELGILDTDRLGY